MNTVSLTLPLGELSLDHAADPSKVKNCFPAALVQENVDALTPLPHFSAPDTTPHAPLLDFIVKPLEVEDVVMPPGVWLDHSPVERMPPVDLPEEVIADSVNLVGLEAESGSDDSVGEDGSEVGVEVGLDEFGGAGLAPVLGG